MGSFYKSVLKVLDKFELRYLIVGGFAVNFHGYSRSTAVRNIWIDIEFENLQKLCPALKEIGFEFDEEGLELLQKKEMVPFSEGDCTVELMPRMNISGQISFEQAYDRSDLRRIDGIDYHIISLNDLIIEKSKSKRYKDLDDLSKLEEAAAYYKRKSKEK